jgi:hypothetical protein
MESPNSLEVSSHENDRIENSGSRVRRPPGFMERLRQYHAVRRITSVAEPAASRRTSNGHVMQRLACNAFEPAGAASDLFRRVDRFGPPLHPTNATPSI